jgi:CRISPR/Cas system-associated endonuclease Cas1
VTLSSDFLSGLLETAAIVLHCGERYQPCGWTTPLARTVDLKTFQNQTAKPKRLNEKLWHEMLRGKTLIRLTGEAILPEALSTSHALCACVRRAALSSLHVGMTKRRQD